MRKGAVVGAAAWTVPVLQSALAPAAAASPDPCTGVCGGSCPACPPGTGPCATDADCATGSVCLAGTCQIPYGGTAPCTDSAQCQSGNCSGTTESAGTCLESWPGTTCTTNNQCLSSKCVGGRCFENSVGGSCRTTGDCTDNTNCSSTTRTCGGEGAACNNNNKCMSNRCRGGICVA